MQLPAARSLRRPLHLTDIYKVCVSVCVCLLVCAACVRCMCVAYQESILHTDLGHIHVHILPAFAMLCLAFVCGLSVLANLIGFCPSVRHMAQCQRQQPAGKSNRIESTLDDNSKALSKVANAVKFMQKVSQRYCCCCCCCGNFNFRQQQPATRCSWHAPHQDKPDRERKREREGAEAAE